MLRLVGKNSQRNIGAHGADGFLTVECHGFDDVFDVFGGIAEGFLVFFYRSIGEVGEGYARFIQFFEADFVLVKPIAVGLLGADGIFKFFVADDAALFHVDHKHFTRLQPTFFDDGGLVDGQYAGFGGHNYAAIVGYAVAGGAEAVPVEGGTDDFTVGEGDGGGAVPGFHDGSVVFVEGFFNRVHAVVAVPGFGDEHHHYVGEAAAGEGKQFDDVVEAGRVGLASGDNGEDHIQFFPGEIGGFKTLFAGAEPVKVTLKGVDFTVVGDIAEGLCKFPAREGIGGEAGVHEAECAYHSFVGEIGKIAADLCGHELAFVNDHLVGEGGDIETDFVFADYAVDGMGSVIAQNEEFAFEVVGVFDMVGAGDEHLFDFRFNGEGGGADSVLVHGYAAVGEDFEAEFFGGSI